MIARCPPYPIHSGDRLILHHLTQQLAARGHTIDLLAFTDRPADQADIPHYAAAFRSIRLVSEPVRGSLAYARRLRSRDHFFPDSARAAWSPEMWTAIEDRLKQNSYDVIQFFGGVQVYEYRNLVRDRPTIIVPYESYSLYLQRAMRRESTQVGKLRQSIALRTAEAYERRMFEGYGAVVVLTERDAKALRELNDRLPLAVIPNGVDTDYFAPFQRPPAEPIVAFTGSFDYAPNADAARWLVQRIFPQIRERVPQARLMLIGRDPPATLQAFASPSIEVTGRVPDMRLYLEPAMVVVSPLRMGAGIKNKVLEALALGKPMVATTLSCDGIAVENGVSVMIAESTHEFASAVYKLIRTPPLRDQLSKAGRALIESRYTWATVADQYEQLYAVVRQNKARH